MNPLDIQTLWTLSGRKDFSDFLATVLPESDWAWYDLYLRILYQFNSQASIGNRMVALAATLTVKTNGERDPQTLSAMRAGEAPLIVLQKSEGGNPELVRRVYEIRADPQTLAEPRSRYVVSGSDWQQEAASVQDRFALRIDMGSTSSMVSGEPDLVRAVTRALKQP